MTPVTTTRMREVIRSRHGAGETVSELAEDYALSKSVIRRIVLTEEPKRGGFAAVEQE